MKGGELARILPYQAAGAWVAKPGDTIRPRGRDNYRGQNNQPARANDEWQNQRQDSPLGLRELPAADSLADLLKWWPWLRARSASLAISKSTGLFTCSDVRTAANSSARRLKMR